MLLQVVGQHFAHNAVHSATHLRVAQLCFGLSLKLRFHNLHGNNGGQALTKIVARHFNLLFGQNTALVRVLLQRARQRPTESGQVCTSLVGIDVVDVRMNIFRVRRVVLHGHFNRNTVDFAFHVHHVFNQRLAVLIHVGHKLPQTAFR